MDDPVSSADFDGNETADASDSDSPGNLGSPNSELNDVSSDGSDDFDDSEEEDDKTVENRDGSSPTCSNSVLLESETDIGNREKREPTKLDISNDHAKSASAMFSPPSLHTTGSVRGFGSPSEGTTSGSDESDLSGVSYSNATRSVASLTPGVVMYRSDSGLQPYRASIEEVEDANFLPGAHPNFFASSEDLNSRLTANPHMEKLRAPETNNTSNPSTVVPSAEEGVRAWRSSTSLAMYIEGQARALEKKGCRVFNSKLNELSYVEEVSHNGPPLTTQVLVELQKQYGPDPDEGTMSPPSHLFVSPVF